MLSQASPVKEIHQSMIAILSDTKLKEITDLIPREWLEWEGEILSPEEIREIYYQFLVVRKNNATNFLNEIQDARKALI